MNYDDAVKINLVNYATSVALIHKNGYEIDLYTDDIGKEFFDQIPYDNVYVLNNIKYKNRGKLMVYLIYQAINRYYLVCFYMKTPK